MNGRNNYGSSTSRITKELTLDDVLDGRGQNEWLKTHPHYNFYDLAKEKNTFAIQAIFQNIFSNPLNPKNREVIKSACDTLITLAKEGNDQPSFDFLYGRTVPFVPAKIVAYAFGLMKFGQGWSYNIKLIENTLNVIRENNRPNINESLNKIAEAGIKGFLESNHFEDIKDSENLLRLIKDPLLLQKFSDAFQEINTNANNKDSMELKDNRQSETSRIRP